MKPSRHPEAAFLATMTASATHELRNVLAIIKESAGLMDDMVQLFGRRGTLDQDKVHRTADRIDNQVKRAADILTNLNRLSHTLDEESATLHLGQEVEQVVFLSQRFARKKGLRVVSRKEEGDALVTVHPLRLQMALFSAMECCLDGLPEGAAITVWARERGGVALVEFRGDMEGEDEMGTPSDGAAWTSLSDLVSSLGATVERSDTGFGIRILFNPKSGG